MRRATRLTLFRRLLAATLVAFTLASTLLGSAASAVPAGTAHSVTELTQSSTDGTATDGGGTATGQLPSCPANRNDVAAGEDQVLYVKVAGLIDPVVKNNILDKLDEAEASTDVLAVVLWVNSRGSVLDQVDYLELANRLNDSPLQTGLWVGQPGSTALGGTAELAAAVDLVGVTPNSTIGEIGDRRLPANFGDPFADAPVNVTSETLTADQAIAAGVSIGPSQNVVSIGSFATNLDGFEVFQCANEEGQLETLPVTRAQISGLSLSSQLFHTVASPEVAYLFFVLGLSLLVFELFTAGVGVAGVLGAGLVTLGSYGLAVLPTRWWALGLLLLAMVFLAVDIQTNIPRLYTMLGVSVFVLGTWFLYDGVSMSRVTMVAGLVGVVLYAYTGMPSMVRTRFSTPTIGRTWMIGEIGEAITDVSPEGTVQIRDVSWRAITNRATPVEQGGSVRVIGIDRLVLEVEPEEGGAKDYRDRG